ncbi:hypothetical protein V8F33_005182 [Rhypophila sp. PSN 637]
MCNSFADYWSCGHFRRTRIVVCSRRSCTYICDKGEGNTYIGDCGHTDCTYYYDHHHHHHRHRHRSNSWSSDLDDHFHDGYRYWIRRSRRTGVFANPKRHLGAAPSTGKKKKADRDRLEAYSRDRAQQEADARLEGSSPRSNTTASDGSVGRLSSQSTNTARANVLSTAPTGLLSPFLGRSNQEASTYRVNNQSTTPNGLLSPFPGRSNQAGTSRGNNQSTTPTGSISPLPGRPNQPATNSRGNSMSTTPTVLVNPSSGRLEPNTNNQTVITPRQNINTPDLRTPPNHNFSRSARRPVQEEQISPTPPPLSSRERRTRPGGSGGPGSRVQLTPSRMLRGNDAAPSSNWQRPVQQGGENNMMDVDEHEDEDEQMDID